MRFGKSAAEAAEEPSRGGSGGDFIKYLKNGDTTFRIIEEPDDWTYYWEHFNPAGFSFPCPREVNDPIEDCPGCSSDIEKMSKVSRKVAFNVLEGYNGQDYVNAYKVSNTLAEKLKNRFARQGTITDRDYTITKFKTSGDRTDFDLDGQLPSPVDVSKYDKKDIEQMLVDSYNEQWGNPAVARETATKAAQATQESTVVAKVRGLSVAPAPTPVQVVPQDPPSDPETQQEKEVKEEDLRQMSFEEITLLVKSEVGDPIPAEADTTDKVVDWLMNG